ncbi:MAG: AraC family transcriptional regulator [Angelakisella sp.]
MKKYVIPKAFQKKFMTYLTVLLLPLITLTFFFYTFLIRQVQEIIYLSEQKNYENAAMQIEYSLNQLKDMAIQFGNNRDILSYNLKDSISSRIRVIDMLRYSLSLNETIDDVLLLNSDLMIYTSTGSYQMKSYSDLYGVPLETIYNAALAHSQTSNLNMVHQDSRFVYFSCNYPYSSPYPAGTLIFKVRKDRLIANVTHSSYAIYYDDQLAAATEQDIFPFTYSGDEVAEQPNYKYFTARSGRVSIIAFIDEQITFKQFYDLRMQMLFLEIVTMLASLLLISFFSYRSYKPLKLLNQALIKIGMKDDTTTTEGEIPESIHSLELLFSKNKQLDQCIANEKLHTKELLLSKLLEEHYVNIEDICKSLCDYGVQLNQNEYTTIIFQCNREMTRQEYFDVTQRIRIDALEVYLCYDINRRIVALVGGNRLTRAVLENACKCILVQINSCALEAEAYIGPVYNSINSINQSYSKAVSMLVYRDVSNGAQHFYTAAQLEERKTYYPQNELNSLLVALVHNDHQAIKMLLQAITQQISNDLCDFSFSKTIAYALINTIIKTVNPEDLNRTRDIRRYLNRLEKINCKIDIVELLGEVCLDITNGLDGAIGSEDPDSRLTLIMQYINAHYDDPDFFIGTVAEKFGISVNNLSQQFKRKYNILPSKYLNSIRIEKAKKLLQKTDYNIQEVARQSGFVDFSSFNRNFKSIVSLCPSQYRSINKNMK